MNEGAEGTFQQVHAVTPPRTARGLGVLRDPGVVQAVTISWGVVSAGGLAVVLACWLLPHGWLLGAAPRCWSLLRDGVPCSFCGMTRAFLALSRGEWTQAVALNRGAPVLYLALLLNGAAAAWMMAAKWKRGSTPAERSCAAGHPFETGRET